jgi:hypothetical protein
MAHVDGWTLPQEIPLAVRTLADREAPMAWNIEGGADSSDERAGQGKVLETKSVGDIDRMREGKRAPPFVAGVTELRKPAWPLQLEGVSRMPTAGQEPKKETSAQSL